jgi:MoxR-like ATPase
LNPLAATLLQNLKTVMVGKDSVLSLAMTCLFARGHLLIEDVPGVGKTMLARALATSVRSNFRRIQFTPDLLPSDVTGVSIFHPKLQQFEFHPGPVFTHVLLADEINRASPRTQSALLECMEETQVTVDGTTHTLEDPFFVLATQNPIELDGTYALPEAQLDRFLMRIEIGYPVAADEIQILSGQMTRHPIDDLEPVMDRDQLLDAQHRTRQVQVSQEVQKYIVQIVAATRAHADVRLGISPRGGLALMRASQAHAWIHGVSYVAPDSVKAVAESVLSHRLILHPHREHTGLTKRAVLANVLESVAVPTVPHAKSTTQG